MNKYEFTGETMRHNGATLRRIRRLSDGEVGGWITGEKCLSHAGDCWVGGEAIVIDSVVRDNATVTDHALVEDRCLVSGNACVRDSATVRFLSSISGNVCGDSVVHGSTVRDGATVSGAEIFNVTVDRGAQVVGTEVHRPVLNGMYVEAEDVRPYDINFIQCPAKSGSARTEALARKRVLRVARLVAGAAESEVEFGEWERDADGVHETMMVRLHLKTAAFQNRFDGDFACITRVANDAN